MVGSKIHVVPNSLGLYNNLKIKEQSEDFILNNKLSQGEHKKYVQ